MSLFRKPSTKTLGLKVLAVGEKGTGKSIFSLSFPRAYSLDAENGQSFYENHEVYGRNLLGILNSQDFNVLRDAMDEVADAPEGEIGSFIIDSETKFYQNLTDAALSLEEAKARKAGRDVMDSAVSVRGWGRVKAVATRLQNLKIDLSAKGVNVVSVSQIEDVKKKVGENFVKVGEKPIMVKNADYDYDIIIKLFTEEDVHGNVQYKGKILKDRTGVNKVGDIIDNPSYNVWKEFVESREGAEKLQSTLAKDSEASYKTMEKHDAELEMTVVDRLKNVMAASEEKKVAALKLIKEAKIKNPLAPKDYDERMKLDDIVKQVEAM